MAMPSPEPPSSAFRYALPPGPVAGAAVDIGHVAITIGVLLSGALEVSTADRAGALAAVASVAKGLMVRGLGSATPSVSAAAGHRFTQRHHDFRAPDTVVFTGDCEVGFTHRHDGMTVTVKGRLRYSLEVTAQRPPSSTAPRGWFRRHEKELASIGMVLLVAVPISPTRLSLDP
jgi:hypothetical protein